jgi:hypothetical protein
MSDSETFESGSFEIGSDSTSEEYSEIDILIGPITCACSFSDAKILVFGKRIIKEVCDIKYHIRSNIDIIEIAVYQGYLYALSDHKLYTLTNEGFETDAWNWNIVQVDLEISHISATWNQEHLWLQSESKGGFYLEEFIDIDFFRNYGFTKNDFVDIYLTRVVYRNKEFANVIDAILDGHNNLHLIYKDDCYTKLVLLNWTVYYVRY